MKKLYKIDFFKKMDLASLGTMLAVILFLSVSVTDSFGQGPQPGTTVSGQWSGNAIINPNGYNSPFNGGGVGYKDWGQGVIQLLRTPSQGGVGGAAPGTRIGAAVLSNASPYVTSGTVNTTWTHCYWVYFGCENDAGGDGLSFSFFRSTDNYSSASNGGVSAASAGSGGIGYMGVFGDPFSGATPKPKMITIEFDTYNSACGATFDCKYAGVNQPTTPAGPVYSDDEISIHINGNAQDGDGTAAGTGGLLANSSINIGNIEDSKEHYVCITYTPDVATNSGVLSVSIDGANKINYQLGANNFNSYFGTGVTLHQAWGSGQEGATNPATVSDGTRSIFSVVGSGVNLGPNCPVLPVTWLSFTGQNVGGDVVLNWATSIEKNNQKFIVERSDDKFDWRPIGEVAGAGNASATKNYSFTDTEVSAGVNYYRIRQVDYDGKYDFSSVVAVSQTSELSISIAPNPFTDALTIRSSETGVIGIKIHDILGKLVYQDNKETSDGIIAIQPELLPGTYVITIQTETSIKQEKIIKY